jgi:glycosyl transferase family 25
MKNLNIYIIHYSKLKNRREHIDKLMSKSPYYYEYIEKYDKETLTQDKIDEIYERNETIFLSKSKLWKNKAVPYFELSLEEISCAKKHIYALEKIKNNGSEYNLIIEDDVIPENSDYFDKIEKLLKTRGKWDVLLIGEGMGSNYRKNRIGYKRYFPFKKTFKISHPSTNCLEAYIVKKQSLDKVTSGLQPINMPIDWELAYQFFKKNIIVHWSKHSIFKQGSKNNYFKSALRK